VEGGNAGNDWWDWEQRPGKIHDGKRSAEACGWWGGKDEEDLALAASLGQNAHRMSLEWSRLEPVEGHFSGSAPSRARCGPSPVAHRDAQPRGDRRAHQQPLLAGEQIAPRADPVGSRLGAWIHPEQRDGIEPTGSIAPRSQRPWQDQHPRHRTPGGRRDYQLRASRTPTSG
jgi:hypothetical protein